MVNLRLTVNDKCCPRIWNRTFELVPEKTQGGALLLHRRTDSLYSLCRIGEILHAKGGYVLGLRLPGHGTIPGALAEVD
jgi:alpha-beta hydrolase superfamily lysophospholipase